MSPFDFDANFEALHKYHDTFLSKRGVVLPKKDTQQAAILVYLYINLKKLVDLEELRGFVRSVYPGKSQDIQPRHLKYAGWHILLSGKSGDLLQADTSFTDATGAVQSRKAGEKLPNGYLMLVSVTDPSPDFELKKRRGSIDRESWETLKSSFNNCCAVCGQKKTSLEKGHKDPTKGFDLENVIPMCSDCNNWASKDVVFDDNGRIAALASPRFVKSADLKVRIQIFDELRKDKQVNPSKH